jgi:hypothetical protein
LAKGALFTISHPFPTFTLKKEVFTDVRGYREGGRGWSRGTETGCKYGKISENIFTHMKNLKKNGC